MTSVFNRRLFLERAMLLAGGAAGGVLWSSGLGSAAGQDKPVHNAEEKLKELKIELPVVPKPAALPIVPCVRAGDMLYVSGHTNDDVVRTGVLHDAVHFMQKPFSGEMLAGTLRRVIGSQKENL